MHVRRCSLLVLALVLTSCVGTPSPPWEDGNVNAPRSNRNLLVRAELADFSGESAREVIQKLRPSWLRAVRGASIVAGRVYARIMVDETSRRDLDELNSLYSDDIESMRYLSAADATTKYGTGYSGGAIEITSRGR